MPHGLFVVGKNMDLDIERIFKEITSICSSVDKMSRLEMVRIEDRIETRLDAFNPEFVVVLGIGQERKRVAEFSNLLKEIMEDIPFYGIADDHAGAVLLKLASCIECFHPSNLSALREHLTRLAVTHEKQTAQ